MVFGLESAEQGNRIERKLDALLALVKKSVLLEVVMTGELEALRAQVEAQTVVDKAAADLLKGLNEKLQAAIDSGNMSEVQALADQVKANNDALAAAVAANTPSASAPAPAPAPETPTA